MKKELLTIAAMLGTTVLSGMMLARVPEKAAADTVDSFSVAVSSSCSLSVTGGTFTDTITPAGSSSKTTSTSDITVSCNDANGWSMYAVGFGNNTKGNTNLTSAGGDIIPTTNSGGSYWSMKLAPTEETETSEDVIVSSYQSFTSVPSDYDKVASMDSDTASADGSSISTFYEVYATAIQAPGTYTGKVKYVLVHPSTAVTCNDGYGDLNGTCVALRTNTVNFAGRGVNSVTFTATNNFDTQTVSATGSTVSLIPGLTYIVTANIAPDAIFNNFTTTAGTLSSPTSSSTNYIPADSNATMTVESLMPTLCNPSGTTITEIACMQDISADNKSSILASMEEGTSYNLADARDATIYRVSKLKDGKIWMQDNLALEGAIELTPDNTNITKNFTLPASTIVGETNAYDIVQLNSDSKNTVIAATGYAPEGKMGVHYNYCAATAGTYCYAGGASTGNATEDICPKGWRMPTGGNGGEYNALYIAYGSNAAKFSSAFSTVLSGVTYFEWTPSIDNIGLYGFFWSSTRADGTRMYRLQAFSERIAPLSYMWSERFYGFNVRCLVQ